MVFHMITLKMFTEDATCNQLCNSGLPLQGISFIYHYVEKDAIITIIY